MAWQLMLLYDGDCPMCRREVAWLQRRDRVGNLALADVAAVGFNPSRFGLTREEAMSQLHGIRRDGTLVWGMEAVRAAYQAVGLGWLVAPTRLPGMRALSDLAYRWFARNRLALGRLLRRTCPTGGCSLPTKKGGVDGRD
jgi:predicted DCC family thiol-disulfide oxidoreductase YuxK